MTENNSTCTEEGGIYKGGIYGCGTGNDIGSYSGYVVGSGEIL